MLLFLYRDQTLCGCGTVHSWNLFVEPRGSYSCSYVAPSPSLPIGKWSSCCTDVPTQWRWQFKCCSVVWCWTTHWSQLAGVSSNNTENKEMTNRLNWTSSEGTLLCDMVLVVVFIFSVVVQFLVGLIAFFYKCDHEVRRSSGEKKWKLKRYHCSSFWICHIFSLHHYQFIGVGTWREGDIFTSRDWKFQF